MLLISIIALVYGFFHRQQLSRIKGGKFLQTGFIFWLVASICTNLEVFFWGSYLNFIEHFSYMTCVLLLLFWLGRYRLVSKNILGHE